MSHACHVQCLAGMHRGIHPFHKHPKASRPQSPTCLKTNLGASHSVRAHLAWAGGPCNHLRGEARWVQAHSPLSSSSIKQHAPSSLKTLKPSKRPILALSTVIGQAYTRILSHDPPECPPSGCPQSRPRPPRLGRRLLRQPARKTGTRPEMLKHHQVLSNSRPAAHTGMWHLHA